MHINWFSLKGPNRSGPFNVVKDALDPVFLDILSRPAHCRYCLENSMAFSTTTLVHVVIGIDEVYYNVAGNIGQPILLLFAETHALDTSSS